MRSYDDDWLLAEAINEAIQLFNDEDDEGHTDMRPNNFASAIRAKMNRPMRDESFADSVMRLASKNPRIWMELQKATNQHNDETGDRATIYDVMSDQGRAPVHMSGKEDMMLGDVPDMPMKGRHGDDRMGMVTPEQERLLKQYGGSGTRNPRTGMREYFGGDGGDGGWGGDGWGGDGFSGGGGPGDDGNDTGNGDFGSMSETDTGGWGGGSAGTSFDGVTEGDLNMNPEGTSPGEAWGFGGSGDGAGDVAIWSPNDRVPRNLNVFDDLEDEARPAPGGKTGSGADPNASSTMGLGNSFRAGLQGARNAVDKHFADPVNTMSFLAGPLTGPVFKAVDWAVNKYGDPNAPYTAPTSEGTGTDDPMLQSGGATTQAPAPAPVPNFMTAQLPESWKSFYGSDFDTMLPYQLRTGAATQAMFGPGAVFTTPESIDYWRRLATESINALDPPEAVDLQFLERILGRPRPTEGTAEAFLEALKY